METWMITGVTGFLGPRVEVTLREKGEVEVLPMTREELNFTDEEQVKRVLGTLHPDVLVHAAAVSDTGACERDPEGSWKVNVTGVEYLSKACRENGTKLIFASSDQVYTGSEVRMPHREDEILTPANVYGREKLEAERIVANWCPEGVSLRLTWMYDLPGKLPVKPNFITNIRDAMDKGELLSFSENDFRGLTDGRIVAERITHLKDVPGGVYNFGSPNALNFYETAVRTVEALGGDSEKIVKRREDGNFRNLAFSTAKLEAAGIFFPDTIEGILNRLTHLSEKF